jgi:hypothetical protein
MKMNRRGFMRGLVVAIAAAALPISHSRATPVGAAPLPVTDASRGPGLLATQAPEWVPLGPEVEIRRLFTPASGPLFAASTTDLYRSDDAGATWNVVNLPGRRRASFAVEVDPLDHRVLYVDTNEGLQRSGDEGATWSPIFPSNRMTLRLAVSPADPTILYLAQASNLTDYWFSRSRDRGATWEQLEEHHNSMCGWGVYILTPHPTDPSRVFRTNGCYAGRDSGDILEVSRDLATTWQQAAAPRGAFPSIIVGGGGADPSRLILAANTDARSGGSTVFTSPDDGATWMPILERTGGGTATGSKDPNVTVGGLAYNPAAPDTIYVALNSQANAFKPIDFATSRVSNDGGATWTALGQRLPEVRALALGIDALNLFAATKTGVMRLPLG